MHAPAQESDLLTDQAAPNDQAAEGSARGGIGVRLDEERRRASRPGDQREGIFGAQSGRSPASPAISSDDPRADRARDQVRQGARGRAQAGPQAVLMDRLPVHEAPERGPATSGSRRSARAADSRRTDRSIRHEACLAYGWTGGGPMERLDKQDRPWRSSSVVEQGTHEHPDLTAVLSWVGRRHESADL